MAPLSARARSPRLPTLLASPLLDELEARRLVDVAHLPPSHLDRIAEAVRLVELVILARLEPGLSEPEDLGGHLLRLRERGKPEQIEPPPKQSRPPRGSPFVP